jgi:signal transduction histidine kinase
MHTTAIASAVIAAGWLLTAFGIFAGSRDSRFTRLGVTCLLLAGVHAAAAAWKPLAPLTIAAWLGYGLVVPRGSLETPVRRVIAAVAGIAAIGWCVVLGASDDKADTAVFLGAAIVVAAGIALAVALRYRHATADERRILQWLTASGVLLAGFAIVVISLHAITGVPQIPRVWITYALVLIPLGQLLAVITTGTRAAAVALTESIAVAGLAALVSVVYLVIVVGIHGPPETSERGVLLASLAAAVVVAVLALPVRRRLVGVADTFIGNRDPSTDEVATAFSARMSRAVPMDELLLQLAESLRATGAGVTAEIWTGSDGTLTRAVSVPSAPPARLLLADRERQVVGQTRIGGPGWATVWMPTMLTPPTPTSAAGDLRLVPVAHLGELLGLIVVRRPAELAAFTEEDETPLVELARQLGLALHNVRLDSALQASLAELAERNEELQASRLRIVSAADDSRRAIERNLHDGAQQHLVALAVKLGLAAAIAEDGDTETVRELVSDLRADVQTTITELRELAHGIYPPLLRARGLPEALRTAANRSPLSCSVEVDVPSRYPEQIEATIYFCCLEAMQNAGKYAGEGAQLTVRVRAAADTDTNCDVLCVEVVDDGAGFDAAVAAHGQGFVNMRDRLGAIGAELVVESSPSKGTKVSTRITIPATEPAEPVDVSG